MKLIVIALVLLSSQAFAVIPNNLKVPIYKCDWVGRFSETTGVEYAKVSPTIMVRDACASQVEERSFVTGITFTSYDPKTLHIFTESQDYSQPNLGVGMLSVTLSSVDQARRIKTQIENGTIAMLVINPQHRKATEILDGGSAIENSEINLYKGMQLTPDQLLLVHAKPKEKGAIARFIDTVREKL